MTSGHESQRATGPRAASDQSPIVLLGTKEFAAAYAAHPGPKLLIDTRNHDEVAAGKLRGARVIPMNDFEAAQESLPRNETLFLYCRSGNRAQIAAQHLSQLGWTDLRVAVNTGFEQLRHELPTE